MTFLELRIILIPILSIFILLVIALYFVNICRRIAVALEEMAKAQRALSDNLTRLEAQRLTQPTPDAEA